MTSVQSPAFCSDTISRMENPDKSRFVFAVDFYYCRTQREITLQERKVFIRTEEKNSYLALINDFVSGETGGHGQPKRTL